MHTYTLSFVPAFFSGNTPGWPGPPPQKKIVGDRWGSFYKPAVIAVVQTVNSGKAQPTGPYPFQIRQQVRCNSLRTWHRSVT